MEECDICGAKLDAGEKCDCLKEIKFVEMGSRCLKKMKKVR